MRIPVVIPILLCFTFYSGACRFSLACDLNVTATYIENSCGLGNGVRFEELAVDSFSDDGVPKVYKVAGSYAANPYANGPSDKVKDRIYFAGRKNDCYWRKDSATNGIYRNSGVSRELLNGKEELSKDTAAEVRTYLTQDSLVVTGGKADRNIELYSAGTAIKCPLTFKANTWYYIDFRDARNAAYLYIDRNMNFTLYKIDIPTNF
jgi:hypothetical protein